MISVGFSADIQRDKVRKAPKGISEIR